MEKIIVGFSKSKKKFAPFSWIIQAVLGTPFSHVYVKFYSSKYERWLIYQASGTQVNFMSEPHFNRINEVTDEIELEISETSKNDMMRFCIDSAGAPYGLKELFGIFLNEMYPNSCVWLKNLFSNGHHSYICSELVGYILKDYAKLDINKNFDLITPKDIYVLLKNINNL